MIDQNENIKCAVRIKPSGDSDKKINEICASKLEDQNIIIVDSKLNGEIKQFPFDIVFPPTVKQEDVFGSLANPLLEAFFKGYNCTIFAYGQTGSGKTHTMLGPVSSLFNSQETTNLGLIPRILNSIFSQIELITSNSEDRTNNLMSIGPSEIVNTAIIKCSCLELYQEQMIDLLNNNSENLIIREDLKRGMYVDGIMEKQVEDPKNALELVLLGLKNRHVSATKMNSESSRSHLIFTIFLDITIQDEKGLVKNRNSRMHLIDLAGSERQKTSGATGDRIREAGMINKSLSTLGNVINALVENSSESKTAKFIPFRDSKLTYFLKDSLGGNSKTTIIANISPSLMNVQETISTLKFVQRAKQIKNKAIINENVSGTVKLLQEEIQRLKDELEQRLVVCKNCMINPKKSITTIPSNFESKQSSLETQNENNIIQGCNREEVKEFCNKIEILLNYERITNEKLSNIGKVSKSLQEINDIRKKYKKESKRVLDELEKRLCQFDQITRLKEGFMNDFKKANLDEQKDVCDRIDKFLTEFSNFKSSFIDNTFQNYKTSVDNQNLKFELQQITKSKNLEGNLLVFNKQNVEILSSIINEFVETNRNLENYFKENIEIYIKDKKIEKLLFQVDDYKLTEDNLKRTIEELQNENFLLCMEIQKFKNSHETNITGKPELESYQNLEKKIQKLNINLNEREIEYREKCNEIESKFNDINELKNKIKQQEKKIEEYEFTVAQQKDDLDTLYDGNALFENTILNLKEKIEFNELIYSQKDQQILKLREDIDEILDFVREISSENQKNLVSIQELNSLIMNNNHDSILLEYNNLLNRNIALNRTNNENIIELQKLQKTVLNNIKLQNEFFAENQSFDDKVRDNLKLMTISYNNLLSIKSNSKTNNITIFNNTVTNQNVINQNNLILLNLKNFMKYFDMRIEYFNKIHLNKIKQQKEKISKLKNLIILSFDKNISNRSFSILKENKKEEIFSNINNNTSAENQDFIIHAYELKIEQLNERIQKMDEELSLYNNSNKISEEVNHLNNVILEYKRKLEAIESQSKLKLNSSCDVTTLNKSAVVQPSKNKKVDVDYLYNELLQSVLKINFKIKDLTKTKHERALNIIKMVEDTNKSNHSNIPIPNNTSLINTVSVREIKLKKEEKENKIITKLKNTGYLSNGTPTNTNLTPTMSVENFADKLKKTETLSKSSLQNKSNSKFNSKKA